MDLKNRTLEGWLKKAPKSAYPMEKKVDYYSLYKALKDYLLREVHNQVNIGANLKDPDILINDHGSKHIDTVIERASNLVSCKDCNLTAFEVYILLVSIQIHDTGNIFGRYKHELNVDKIMLGAEKLCGRDTIEMIFIRNVAQAHGGEIRGVSNKKDKISRLNESDQSLNGTISSRAIASLLRFADELSDDKSRAYTKLLKENQIPRKSEVFHAYASVLDAVAIKHNEKAVELYFKIPKEFAMRLFGKLDEEIFLLDEIYNRVMKMHLERIYCMRFLKRIIDIEKISVFIDFYDNFIDIFPQINFDVSESGYPIENENGIYSLCKSLTDTNGNKIDGEYVRKKICQEN